MSLFDLLSEDGFFTKPLTDEQKLVWGENLKLPDLLDFCVESPPSASSMVDPGSFPELYGRPDPHAEYLDTLFDSVRKLSSVAANSISSDFGPYVSVAATVYQLFYVGDRSNSLDLSVPQGSLPVDPHFWRTESIFADCLSEISSSPYWRDYLTRTSRQVWSDNGECISSLVMQHIQCCPQVANLIVGGFARYLATEVASNLVTFYLEALRMGLLSEDSGSYGSVSFTAEGYPYVPLSLSKVGKDS